MEFLNKHKRALTFLLSALIAVYAVFLLVLPNVLDLNNYKKDIQKIVKDNSKLDLEFSDIKIITTWDLKAGVKIKGAALSYPQGSKPVSLDSAELKIAVLPLIFKTLRVTDVTLDSLNVNLIYLKDGQLDVADYILKNISSPETATENAAVELPIRISNKLPVVKIKNYNLSLKDEISSNVISINGESLVLDKAEINKHLRAFAKGKMLVNGRENIVYDINFSSFWPALQSSDEQTPKLVSPRIDFINEIVKYDPKADIKADLDLKEHKGHLDLSGEANVDKMSIKLDEKRLPDSYLHLKSTGHNTNIDSKLYVSADEKAAVLADIKHSRKTRINLNVKTDKISFSSLQKFVQVFMNSLNIENDFDSIQSSGYINADFILKTDLKNFESAGFFKVHDGSISHKTIPVRISDIKCDVDFSDNAVNINKANASVNGTTLEAKGKIDSNANADISVDSGKIEIAPLFNAFAPADLKKAYVLKNGILGFNVLIKGQLAEIEPNINVSLKSLSLKDRMNTLALSNNSTFVNIKTKGSSFSGEVSINGSNVKMHNPYMSLNAPSIKIQVNPEDIAIVPFSVTMNSSKLDVSGNVKDYMKNMKIDISMKGSVYANEIRNLLPNDVKSFVEAKGLIPLNASLSGNNKKLELKAQAFSNSANYFAPLIIKKMAGQTGLINLTFVYSDDNLNLTDAALYQTNKPSFSSDFSYNKKGALKVASISGNINDISSSHPELRLNFSIPQSVLVSTPFMPSASLKVKGDVNIYGTMTAPLFKGFFAVKDVNLPDLLTKVQDVDLELNDEILTAKVQNLNINGTSLNLDADASTKFGNIFFIRTMNVTSSDFNADNLFQAMDKMSKTMPVQAPAAGKSKLKGPVFPVKISNGSIDIQRFKMKQAGGDLLASNISGDFNLVNDIFTLNNLKAAVYNGSIEGRVIYNLATTQLKAKINGKGINSNPVVTVFANLKDQMAGNVDFSADVSLKGASYEQQMKSLNGKVHFSLKDGQMGSLGRFETFLKADNLISQGFIVTKIGSLINTVAPFNTGKFAYLNGDLKIVNGIAHLNPVKMSGPHMSLLINGRVNILTMLSNLEIMGSLSPDVVKALGPVADLSVEKFAAYIPKFGNTIANALNTYNAPANKADMAKIPQLTPVPENPLSTKSFKVMINGSLNNPPSAVKRFQWLNTPEKIQQEQQSLLESVKPVLPASKEELKQQVKEGIQNQLENNEKIQELKQNKAVQTFSSIYKFYKDSSKPENTSGAEVKEGSY